LRTIGCPVSDYLFVKALFFLTVGEKLDLKNPQKFNEKMQWLKVYDHNPLYHKLVDKIDVKEYVSKIIGEEHIIKTLGVWDNFDSIEWDSLPSRFVLKTSAGGGSTGVIVCKNKKALDKKEARRKLEASMKYDIYKMMGEWVYKGLPQRILAEEYIEPSPNINDLPDFKFWCFNGEPQILFYASERFNKENHLPYFDYYDMDLNRLPIKSRGHAVSPNNLTHFPQFEKMKEIARSLSANIPFVRVDLYLVNNVVYFGELTFYHDSGFVPLEPKEWDDRLGDLLQLPSL
jgi:hypothetical protein